LDAAYRLPLTSSAAMVRGLLHFCKNIVIPTLSVFYCVVFACRCSLAKREPALLIVAADGHSRGELGGKCERKQGNKALKAGGLPQKGA
jgi:hypothetical protein